VHDAGRALRDFATYLPTRAIPAIAGLIVLPLLARKLFPTDLGVLTIDQTLITLGWTVIGSWLTAAVVREYPAYRLRGDVAGFERTLRRAVALIFIGIGIFGLLLLGLGHFSAAIGDYVPYIIAAAAGLVVQNVAVSLFAASLRPRAYAAVEIVARVGGIAIGITLVFKGHGVAGYLLGLAIASAGAGIPGVLLAWPRARTQRGAPATPTAVRSWLSYGVPTSSGAVLDWALAFIDRYILQALRNSGTVGIYAVGNIIGDRMVSVPLNAFGLATTPRLLTAYEHSGRAEVERLMRAYTRVVLLIGVPIVAYTGAISGRLVPALTHSSVYAPAIAVAPTIALGALLYSLSAVAATGLSVAKHTRPLVYASAIGLAVNVAANFALIPRFGIMGAAVSTPISMAVVCVAVYAFARRYVTWRFPVATLVRCCAAAGAGYGAAVGMTHVTAGPAPDLISSGVVGLAVYGIVLALLGEHWRGLSIAPVEPDAPEGVR